MSIPVCLSGRQYAVLPNASRLKAAHRLVDAHNIYRRPVKCRHGICRWDLKCPLAMSASRHRCGRLRAWIVAAVRDVKDMSAVVAGRDVMSGPLLKRRTRLAAIVGQNSTIRLSQDLPGSAANVVRAVRAAGLEGAIAKRKDSVYQPGERSADWVKLKLERQTVRPAPAGMRDAGDGAISAMLRRVRRKRRTGQS
jgi:hypothetical protein